MPRKNRAIVGKAVPYQIPAPADEVQLETFIPWTLVKRGVKREVIKPFDAPEAFREEAAAERQARKASEDSALVRALGLAHYGKHFWIPGRRKRRLTSLGWKR